MAQELSPTNENFLPEIESLIKFFDAVLNNQEFPDNTTTRKIGHDILHIAIGLYQASFNHKSNMTLENVLALEPELARKIKASEELRGKSFLPLLHRVLIASNCFFERPLAFSENLSAKISQEQPYNLVAKPLAETFVAKNSLNQISLS